VLGEINARYLGDKNVLLTVNMGTNMGDIIDGKKIWFVGNLRGAGTMD